MTQYAIVTDLNRCVGCLGCIVACKTINNTPIGKYNTVINRVGPTPIEGMSGQWPDVEMYFLPVGCQHCENPACVDVCPTSASYVAEDGTVQIDKELCIGCQSCMAACPYGVRFLNEDENVVEKCTLCKELIDDGGLPQCVTQCGGMARWFGDIEGDIRDFKGARGETLGEFCEDFDDSQVFTFSNDAGTNPNFRYILRNMKWQATM